MELEEYRVMFGSEDTHWWYRGLRAVFRRLLQLDRISRDSRFLDAGCGTGGNLAALRAQGFSDIHGIDVNPPALYFCRRRGLDNVREGSLADIPHPDRAFDVVLACDVIQDEGVKREADALAELYRVLKPGGRLFINVPAFRFLRSEHDQATGVARRYTLGEIKSMLRRADFRIERATYWNALLFPIVVVVRLFRPPVPEGTGRAPRSDVYLLPRPVNALLSVAPWFESRLLRFIDLPFGSSVAVVARRPSVEKRRVNLAG